MTNISKTQLSEKHFKDLFNKMTKLLAGSNQADAALFLSDLLGKEEKIMLVKRFAAVMLLAEGNSSYRVWQSLLLSPSTAEIIKLDYERGRYLHLVNLLKKNKKNYHDIWLTLETMLRAGLPPRGQGRWKSVLEKLK